MARKEAEHLLETKSREVFEASQALERENLRVARKSTEIQLLHDVIAAGHVEQTFTESLREFVHAVCALTGWPLGYALTPSESDPAQLKLVEESLLERTTGKGSSDEGCGFYGLSRNGGGDLWG